MHDDKKCKELLMKGGLVETSPAFTRNVMKGIERISYINAPLVNKKSIRIFRIIYVTILGLLLLESLLIKISTMPFTINLQLPVYYIQYTDTIVIYIIAFWALLFLSKKMENKAKKYE